MAHRKYTEDLIGKWTIGNKAEVGNGKLCRTTQEERSSMYEYFRTPKNGEKGEISNMTFGKL